MAYKRLDPEDIVISNDAVSSTVWSTNVPALTSFFTSSIEISKTQGAYYYNVYATQSININDVLPIEFSIAYGNKQGSGSNAYNSSVPSLSPTSTMYRQYRNLIYGDENAEFIFGDKTSDSIYIITPDRARYKQKLLPGSLNMTINGVQLTDNSKLQTTQIYTDAGRVYQIVSGSNGSGSYTPNTSGSYGLFLPDIGTIIINDKAFGTALGTSYLPSSVSNATNNMSKLLSKLTYFRLNTEETVTSELVYVRGRNFEFNYSENPSFISSSNGELVYPLFINNPQTYITTVGLYNDSNELLAVAKLSRPLVKDFTKELLLRVKLDF